MGLYLQLLPPEAPPLLCSLGTLHLFSTIPLVLKVHLRLSP